MRLIITGGAGFIGSALVKHAVGKNHDVLTIDKLTYAGRLETLEEVLSSPRHRFLQADISDADTVNQAFSDFDPDIVLHLAAESHVDRSIDDPGVFVTTNVNGTVTLLEAAMRQWSTLSDQRREKFRFVHVSTDEVFGSLGATGVFSRESKYAPNSPYAASKAASDHFVRAYHETYGIPTIVTNCTNNYGPWQHSEKFIPTVIRHALEHAPIPLYGSGMNVRDWLYVGDHVDGLMTVAKLGRPGEIYLFGGRNELRNSDIARTTCKILDERRPRPDGRSYVEQIVSVADRPGHDFRYAIDPSQVEYELGWRAATPFEVGLADTIDWYLRHQQHLLPTRSLGRLGNRQ
jgi:dTDP-glucose 4,6-dehydratase